MRKTHGGAKLFQVRIGWRGQAGARENKNETSVARSRKSMYQVLDPGSWTVVEPETGLSGYPMEIVMVVLAHARRGF